MAGPMAHVDYTGDDGVVYRLRMDASNASAAGLPASTAGVNPPKGMRPRYILAAHPTSGRQRRITVNADSALFVGGLGTISLPDFAAGGAAANYNVQGRVGEKRRFI